LYPSMNSFREAIVDEALCFLIGTDWETLKNKS
jgi:hypothetical protein